MVRIDFFCDYGNDGVVLLNVFVSTENTSGVNRFLEKFLAFWLRPLQLLVTMNDGL